MTIEAENPPAFPSQPCGPDGMPTEEMQAGMSLRDWFAGQFITSPLCRASGLPDYELNAMFGGRGGIRREEIIAAEAYRLADAMLSARHPTQEQG